MINVNDPQIIMMFDNWKNHTGKYSDLQMDKIIFDEMNLIQNKSSDYICEQRMGFTPNPFTVGDMNWFTIKDLSNHDDLIITQPNTNRKILTDKKSIKSGDILVSFKLSIGITKIYASDLPSCCNEAIDILTCKDGFYNKYVAYQLPLAYSKTGAKTNHGKTLNKNHKKEIMISIPQKYNGYSSYEIQVIIGEFIYYINNYFNSQLEIIKYNKDSFFNKIIK